MKAGLIIEGLQAAAGSFRLSVPSLSVVPGEIFILLGRSGAGKTLFLESLAGFQQPTAGRIELFGRPLLELPIERRRVAVIFQDYALFPHMTVRQNILFGARHQRIADSGARLVRLVEMLGIAHLVERSVEVLSGGEKQRVGLARALMLEPELLVFDEPLGSLDPALRERLRDELRTILKSVGQTAVYVTHDRTEAHALGDRVGVLDGGEILQVGTPHEVFYRPANRRVAEYVGVENLLPATLLGRGGNFARVSIGNVELTAAAPASDGSALACLHSDAVFLSRGDRPGAHANRVRGRVERIARLGSLAKVYLDCGFPLVCTTTRGALDDLALSPGDAVEADFRPESVHLIAG